MPAEAFARELDRDERILGHRLVDPRIQRRQLHRFELAKDPQRGTDRQRADPATVAGLVEHRLEVLAQRRELCSADVVRAGLASGGDDRGAQILDVEQLVAIVAAAEDREVAPLACPLVHQREHAEPLGPDE